MWSTVAPTHMPLRHWRAATALRVLRKATTAWRGSAFESGAGGRMSEIAPYRRKSAYKFSCVKSGPANSTLSFGLGYRAKSSIHGTPFTGNARGCNTMPASPRRAFAATFRITARLNCATSNVSGTRNFTNAPPSRDTGRNFVMLIGTYVPAASSPCDKPRTFSRSPLSDVSVTSLITTGLRSHDPDLIVVSRSKYSNVSFCSFPINPVFSTSSFSPTFDDLSNASSVIHLAHLCFVTCHLQMPIPTLCCPHTMLGRTLALQMCARMPFELMSGFWGNYIWKNNERDVHKEKREGRGLPLFILID